MSYPKIYKAEALVNRSGKMHIALYEATSGFDLSTPGFREGNGPNYLFKIDHNHPACPGFTTLLAEARNYGFDDWEETPYAIRITDGEAPVEHYSMLDWGGRIVASWEGNAKKPTVIDQQYSAWISR